MSGAESLEKVREWSKQSLGLKLFVVAVLVMLLLVPGAMITGIVAERQSRREEAVAEICGKWGRAQTLTGPVLTVPYRALVKDEKGKDRTVVCYARFLPNTLDVRGTIYPEIRYRGIYEAVLYNARLNIEGTFDTPDFSVWHVAPQDVLWDDAVVAIGVSDMAGIRDSITLAWGSERLSLEPLGPGESVVTPGLGTRLKPGTLAGTVRFTAALDLNGSGQVSFVPLGKTTSVEISSAWAAPSFTGAFLPESRSVADSGFSARWKVLHYNRDYPQQWVGAAQEFGASAFGVELLLPVDGYQKTTRTAKYAVLFITLTFLCFFLIEVMLRRRVHPVQYLLVGFALCIFYLLLLSLSEHAGFGLAYLGAAMAVVALVTGYSRAVLGSVRLAAVLAAVLSGLYVFLYVVLQLEDYALLMGSAGLLAILGAVMYLTRKIDWYALGRTPANTQGKGAF